jgi:hypothetical protein
MSVTLAIALNVIFDAGILGALAWVMTRPHKLTPHEPAAPGVEVIQLHRGATVEVERERRAA